MSPAYARRLIAAAIIIAYVFATDPLIDAAAWPANCDPDEVRRRLVLIREFRCSPHLLDGGRIELAAFTAIWAMPLLVLALYLFLLRRRSHAA